MRLKSLTIHGFGPFHNETAELFLDEIKGRIVAVCGDNGQGKSTLLELFPGAIYRECPTRGALIKLATRRDAYVKATIVNGREYRITQKVDSHNGKGESLVQDETGKALLTSAKVREYDDWSAKNLPAPDTFYAGPFTAQGSRGIVDQTPGERKATLLRMIGIERYERLSAAARERAKAAAGRLETCNARIADEKERGGDVDELKAHIDKITIELDQARSAVTTARAAYDRALESSKDAKKAEEVRTLRAQISARINAANRERWETEKRIENNRKLLERGDEIRDAVRRTAEIDKGLEETRVKRAGVEKEIAVAESDQRALQREFDELNKRGLTAKRDKAQAETILMRREEIEKAVEGLAVIGEKIQTLESERDRLERRNQDITGFLLSAKDERIGGLRKGLSKINDELIDDINQPTPKEIAERSLYADDELAKRSAAAPAEAAENKTQIVEISRQLKSARDALKVTERIAAERSALAAAEQTAAKLTAEIEQNGATLEQITSNMHKKRKSLDTAHQIDVYLLDKINKANADKNKLERLANMATNLSQAEARIDELGRALEQSRDRAAAAQRELDATPALDVDDIDIGKYTRAVELSEGRLADQADALSRAKQALEAAEASGQRIVTLERDREVIAIHLSDWTRLAHDLGRDGLQAVEIDAAIPELNEIANDLLRNTFGARFTVELSTNRLASDGKRLIEDLEIRVIDTINGRDAPIDTYSGGEVVIVGEAIALALTTLSCRSLGIERPTIVRDESGAALDRENGAAYISMLRRAADLINADKVLFVSHSDHLWQYADARIVVENGSLRID